MKVRDLRTGEIVEAKRFKNMTDEEKESTGIESECEGEEIFIEPRYGGDVWKYMYDHEVKIIEEED